MENVLKDTRSKVRQVSDQVKVFWDFIAKEVEYAYYQFQECTNGIDRMKVETQLDKQKDHEPSWNRRNALAPILRDAPNDIVFN